MNDSRESYIINLLLSLKEGHLFEDEDLHSHLKELSENYFSEEAVNTAKEDALQFLSFYKKNSFVVPKSLKEASTTPTRLYVDGVFDMVHSGHFNAIRQVAIVSLSYDDKVNRLNFLEIFLLLVLYLMKKSFSIKGLPTVFIFFMIIIDRQS